PRTCRALRCRKPTTGVGGADLALPVLARRKRSRDRKGIPPPNGRYCLPARRRLMGRIKPIVRPIVQSPGLTRTNLASGVSFSSSYVTEPLEACLKRVRTDYIDRYQLHSPGASFLGSDVFGEALETLEKLKGRGKLRLYGVAEVPQDAPFFL